MQSVEPEDERFELNLGIAIEFAIAGAVVWLVGFTVASYFFGWF